MKLVSLSKIGLRCFINFTSVFLLTSVALAQTDLSVRGSGKLYPIALPRICAENNTDSAAKEIVETISRALDVSGFFEVLNSNSYIESPGNCAAKEGFAYSDWSVIGAEGLVKGVVTTEGNLLKIQMYLHDVPKQRAVLGKEYSADPKLAKQIAYRFANEIMRFFTGVPGVFGTELVFSSRIGRFKELFIMNMDGSDIRQLTQDRGLAISASWHPSGNEVIYTSYRNRIPDLFLFNLNRGSFSQLSRGIALELGAKYSSDGSQFLMSRTVDGESDIVLSNSDGTIVKTLTSRNGSIDVSPVWSHDNRQVAFCSNRGGGPQIYVMNADGSNPHRISFVTSNYCTSPAWSPMGDKIAFVCRSDVGFQLFVSNTDGSKPLQITSSGSSEDPSWAPNGQYIVFSSTFGFGGRYQLALIRPDGTGLKQLTFRKFDDTQPSWGPLPLELRTQ